MAGRLLGQLLPYTKPLGQSLESERPWEDWERDVRWMRPGRVCRGTLSYVLWGLLGPGSPGVGYLWYQSS